MGETSRSFAVAGLDENQKRRLLKQHCYLLLQQLSGDAAHPWGIMTGVRPTKIVHRYWDSGMSVEQIKKAVQEEYFVQPDKAALLVDVTQRQRTFLLQREEAVRQVSVYLSIPFCPTRCAYCSFPAFSLPKPALQETYLTNLLAECQAVGQLLRQQGKQVQTVYIGGGTPTSLNADQLQRLLEGVQRYLVWQPLQEFTVEAGRPDTITADKMAVLRDLGVDRVSVNPQTMQDEVLRAMGRSHTAADILTAYDIVRKSGIPIVNMDLIAGLPKDSVAGFRNTLNTVLSLDPENITVHTLALKKGARLMMEREGLPTGEETSAMLDYAWDALRAAGQIPYYLYRQKYMSGALENIGWCKPGTEGLYNICIMEELHSILALGAGGSTKLTNPATGKVVRLTNPKYPQQYMERIDQLCRDKAELVAFQRSL